LILLYANPHEVKYVNYETKICIGFGAVDLRYWQIRYADQVILFGCSGWRGNRVKWNKLYQWRIGGLLKDMESHKVWKICRKYNIPFKSIRYIIDRDRGRVTLWGINHFWRKYQHRRMQLKFNKYLEDYK